VPGPELSVVCKSCGSEVSPYVTECPYCGTRLRRRAPKLERSGDEIHVRETMRDRRRRRRAERSERAGWLASVSARPYITLAAIIAPAILLVLERATDLTAYDLGAVAGPVDQDWWRYLAAPFVYTDVGYLFAVALAVAIFTPPLEERLGSIPTLLVLIACGALGMLAADGLGGVFGDDFPLAAGGNGIALGLLAAWFSFRRVEVRADPEDSYDPIAVAVAAAVLLALPLVEDTADVWAGLAGGLVGLWAGFTAARGRG
jgi:membrane associated rhomboid family serine protease